MRRILGILILAGVVAGSSIAVAHVNHGKEEGKKAEAKTKTVTVTGEIVDTGCYLGHASVGAKHKECAAKCILSGMPMALLTDKGDLYLLTPPHGNTDAYDQAKQWAAAKVQITGDMNERSGMKSIEVAASKLAPGPNTL